MARLGTWALFVLLLFASASARPVQPKPETAHMEPMTVEEMWALTKGYTLALVSQPQCRNLLFAVTGQDPVAMMVEDTFKVSIPETWPEPYNEFAAITTCIPPIVAMRRGLMMVEGPLFSAVVLIHEIAHVGTCDRVITGDIPESSWEDMAHTVDQFCWQSIE